MALTKVKAGNIILTTPGASSNDVTPATTQYVTTAIGNLVDTAPSTLNTLNELAAALGDDVNFSTTVTNSIATKLPLAGGTMTGDITNSQSVFNITNNDFRLKTSGAETMLRAVGNGAVELMHNNVTRVATSADGATITSLLTIAGSAGGINFTGGNNRIYFTSNRALEGNTDGSILQVGEGYTNMYLQANVSVGTAISPDNTLHVHKGSAGTVDGNTNAPLTVENSAANYIQMLAPNGQESGILFGNPANSADSGIIHSDTDNTLAFRVGNNSNKVIINSDGYIVAQSQANVRIVLGSTGNSSNNSSNWVRGNQGYLQFNSASSGYNWEIAGANKMTMDANGKVTFVAASIDLNNSGTYTVSSATTGTALRGAAVKFLSYSDHRTPLENSMTHGHMGFGFTSYTLDNTSPWADIIYLNSYTDGSGGSPNALVVSRSGSNAKLVRYSWSTTSTDAISTGTQYGLDSASASDERLKENVNDITDGLAVINSLRPVTFNWNDTYIESGSSKNAEESEVESETNQSIKMPSSKVENVGLIAQEVEAVVPTVVHEGQISIGGVDYKNVDYKKLVPHLIAAIQEQQTLIEALASRITALEG